jgi:flagellar hook-length control protein FliK
MDFAITLSPELVSTIDPLGRALPGLIRPPAGASGAGPPPESFELVLQLLGGGGLPDGQLLPAGGNDLPVAAEPAHIREPTDTPVEGATPIASAWPLPAAPAALELGSGAPEAPAPALVPTATAASAGPVDAAVAPLPASPTPREVVSPTSAEAMSDAARDGSRPSPVRVTDGAAQGVVEDVVSAPRSSTDAQAQAPSRADAAVPAARAAEYFEMRSRARPSAPAAIAPQPLEAADALGDAPPPVDAASSGEPVRARISPSDVPRPASSASLDVALPIPAGGESGPMSAVPASPHAPSPSSATSAQTSAATPHQQQPPIDTHAERWHDALASRIQWIVDHDVGEARIKLNPPELGALDVRVAVLDDKTFVQMTAHAAAARDELAQSLPRLRELLVAGGLDLGGATVSGGRDDRASHHAGHEPLARTVRFAAGDTAAASARAPGSLASIGRIDTFA